MKENQNKSSWFVSKCGLLILLFFAVLSIYFHVGVIGAFFCFVSLLSLGSGMWSRLVLQKAEFQIQPIQNFCYAGESLTVQFLLKNRSFFPLVWLDILIPTGTKPNIRLEGQEEFTRFYIEGKEEEQTGIRQRFAWLLWQQEIGWEEQLVTSIRGVVTLDGVGLQAGDGFGLSAKETWKAFSVPHQLFIYPKLVPVHVQPFLKITQEAAARNQGQTEDLTILKSIRPYQPGDSAKRINWRLLASGGGMQVNVYETVMPGCAAFILDLESFLYEEVQKASDNSEYTITKLRETELEEMISFMASCMTAINEQGVRTALLIPAYEAHEAVMLLPDDDGTNLQRCMEQFSCIDYQGKEVRFPYEEFWQHSHKLGTIYLCSWSEETASLRVIAEELGRSRVRYLVLESQGRNEGEWDCLLVPDLLTDGGKGVHVQ